MYRAPSPMGHRSGIPITLGILFLAATHGCSTASEGVLPETGTPVVTRVQGPGGGDVLLTSELSKGVYHLAAPPGEVWTVLPNVFEELGIEINYRNPSARGVGNNQFVARRIGGARNSKYLDCGYGTTATPHADAYEVTASLIASVRPGEGGGTVLETLFTASARAREVSGGGVTCSSKGVLERNMVDLLTSMIGIPGQGG